MKLRIVFAIFATLLAASMFFPALASAEGGGYRWQNCGWGSIRQETYDNGSFDLIIEFIPGAKLPDSLQILQAFGDNFTFVHVAPDGTVYDLLHNGSPNYTVPNATVLRRSADGFFAKVDCPPPATDARPTFQSGSRA